MPKPCLFYCSNANLKLVTKLPNSERYYKCQKCRSVHGVHENDEQIWTSKDGKETVRRKKQGLYDMDGHKRITK